ncbi:hypothetical protein D3C77_725630 [compost metagenome]
MRPQPDRATASAKAAGKASRRVQRREEERGSAAAAARSCATGRAQGPGQFTKHLAARKWAKEGRVRLDTAWILMQL